MNERTLIIIKPDGIQRRLAGEIIGRFEKKGLKIVAAKFLQISLELAKKHYAVHKGKDFFDGAVKYISSGPVLVMVLEGEKVIEITRKMMGATFGYNAEPGTIRGDFGTSQTFNLIHGSDSPETAKYEIGLYFKPDEILDYQMPDQKWV
ncbi:MAG: nucleoside-diphosphate kinase [Sedimentisphaerales bacterium]|jgi:nucleoside-diphosphate kinase